MPDRHHQFGIGEKIASDRIDDVCYQRNKIVTASLSSGSDAPVSVGITWIERV